jgi:hypothetical protein
MQAANHTLSVLLSPPMMLIFYVVVSPLILWFWGTGVLPSLLLFFYPYNSQLEFCLIQVLSITIC